MEKSNYNLDQKQILEFLPHRYPFLLVDRILDVSGPNPLDDDDTKNKIGIKVVGIKNVSMNEPQFQGHFPEMPVMPGVLIVEAMAQVSSFSMYPAVMKKRSVGKVFDFQCVLVGVDDCRFRVPVVPGDTMRIESVVTGCRKTLWTYDCKAYVGDKLIAEAKILANLIPNDERRVF